MRSHSDTLPCIHEHQAPSTATRTSNVATLWAMYEVSHLTTIERLHVLLKLRITLLNPSATGDCTFHELSTTGDTSGDLPDADAVGGYVSASAKGEIEKQGDDIPER